MTDTNGRVAPEHLHWFNSVQVSIAIYARVVATAADFHNSGYSFDIAPPGGGNRPWDMQGAMQADYRAGKYQQAPYYLSPPPSPEPADPGSSRHGFALAIDVVTNAPTAVRNAIMARNGWHLWSSSDWNHFEPNAFNVLVSPPESAFAGGGSTPIEEDDMQQDERDALFAIKSALLDGNATDLSTPKVQQMMNSVADIQKRFLVVNQDGSLAGFDYFQWLHNIAIPALTAAVGQAGGGTPVDLPQLFAASEARLQASFSQTLAQFQSSLESDVVASVTALVQSGQQVTTDEIAAGVKQAFAKAFPTDPAATAAPTTK